MKQTFTSRQTSINSAKGVEHNRISAGHPLYCGTPTKADIAISIFLYGMKYGMIKEANS